MFLITYWINQQARTSPLKPSMPLDKMHQLPHRKAHPYCLTFLQIRLSTLFCQSVRVSTLWPPYVIVTTQASHKVPSYIHTHLIFRVSYCALSTHFQVIVKGTTIFVIVVSLMLPISSSVFFFRPDCLRSEFILLPPLCQGQALLPL